MSVSDAWIAEGCAKARDLLEQGLRAQAQQVLAYVERKALGDRKRTPQAVYHRRQRMLGCHVRDCTNYRLRPYSPWCWRHRPFFGLSEKHASALTAALWCAALHLPNRTRRPSKEAA